MKSIVLYDNEMPIDPARFGFFALAFEFACRR